MAKGKPSREWTWHNANLDANGPVLPYRVFEKRAFSHDGALYHPGETYPLDVGYAFELVHFHGHALELQNAHWHADPMIAEARKHSNLFPKVALTEREKAHNARVSEMGASKTIEWHGLLMDVPLDAGGGLCKVVETVDDDGFHISFEPRGGRAASPELYRVTVDLERPSVKRAIAQKGVSPEGTTALDRLYYIEDDPSHVAATVVCPLYVDWFSQRHYTEGPHPMYPEEAERAEMLGAATTAAACEMVALTNFDDLIPWTCRDGAARRVAQLRDHRFWASEAHALELEKARRAVRVDRIPGARAHEPRKTVTWGYSDEL